MDLEERISQELKQSGLTIFDVRVRPLDAPELTACGLPPTTEGYIIPYYNLVGKPLPFYRIKLFNGGEVKYRQIKNTSNHVYFPPNFLKVLNETESNYIIFTEGEKKAACGTKNKFPTVAFGGVDSWRNRILLLPKDTEFSPYSYNKQLLGAKLPSSSWDVSGVTTETVAVGFDELVGLIRDRNLQVLIAYDSDEQSSVSGMKLEVQRAAADLGFELRRRGIPISNIRQMILPYIEQSDKTGLDDLLTILPNGPEVLAELVEETLSVRSAFPRHPNMEAELNKKLQNAKISRKDMQRICLALIADMDARGIRMFSEQEQQLYYFESDTSRLLKVDLDTSSERMKVTPFTKLLYRYYGLSTSADSRVIKWLLTQFAAEPPVEDVSPYRIFARPIVEEDCIRFQISDGHYAKVTADPKNPIEIMHNGAENILFEADQCEAIDPEELLNEFAKRTKEPLEMWWEDVLQEVRLKNHGKSASLFSLLYYVSPWLFRWRGSQLPAELIIGEAGSGKSTLCELRLSILTGQSTLRNAPADIKDWHASIVNTGGLHVTDNVQLLDKSLKQRLSDEICRLITEPDPHIEQRKYYTNSDLMRVKVSAVFGFTAITQPFQNSDLLQRAVIVELDKLAKESSAETHADVIYDSSWKQAQIDKFGGRAAWVSHHLYVLHRFLALAQKKWKPGYQAKHRLINLEQSLMLMAELFKVESAWIPAHLSSQIDESVVDADWTLEGLAAFCTMFRGFKSAQEKSDFAKGIGVDSRLMQNNQFDARAIANWAVQQEAYLECTNLINARKLGRYLQTHKAMVAQVTGLMEDKKICNRMYYKLKPLIADKQK